MRTAAEGASEEQLRADVERLTKTWEDIRAKAKNVKSAPTLLKGEPELAVRVVRDVFNEDFLSLRIQGAGAWKTISSGPPSTMELNRDGNAPASDRG